jgi:hypothetical protein
MMLNRVIGRLPVLLAVFASVFAAGVTVAPLDAHSSSPVPTIGDASPQHATADDLRLFDRYIGSFRSQVNKFDDGTTEYFNKIVYTWFDHDKTIVKFTVATVIPSLDRVIVTAEGFYGYDPFDKRLYVFGAFTNGTTGWGSIGEFDRDTGVRVVWAQSVNADGVVTHVRDAFEPIDTDSWRNRTSIRLGDETDWNLVYEETFTRDES